MRAAVGNVRETGLLIRGTRKGGPAPPHRAPRRRKGPRRPGARIIRRRVVGSQSGWLLETWGQARFRRVSGMRGQTGRASNTH